MSSTQAQDPVEAVRDALAREAEIAPKERFDHLIASGIIDSEGEILRDDEATEDNDAE